MGVFLASNWSDQTNFVFTNVLAQIGLGYAFLFLLWERKPRTQLLAAALILIGYWALFALYPCADTDFDFARVGLPADWAYQQGFAAHWEKNTNAAAAVDQWFLNCFPRETPFVFNRGGYQTLNFVPSLATMIFGLVAGGLLRSDRRAERKFWLLVGAGMLGVASGWVLGWAGLCPVVKRIWTPSWALLSGGWACLILAAFYGAIDAFESPWQARPARWLAFPLVVVGMNSLTMYFMAQLIYGWVRKTLRTHLSADYAQVFGASYAPIVEATCIVLVLWLLCYWLYRQKVFLRV
jgi:heparan-alpha-glucosaminide N-acetyltransferase